MATLNEERRAVAQQILDRIASDPGFRGQLLDDPQSALRVAGFSPAVQRLRSPDESDVRGYAECVSTCDADSTDLLPGGGPGGGGGAPCPDSGPGPSLACFIFSWCL